MHTEETQNPEIVEQAVEMHDKKSPEQSFAELRRAKEQLERELWQAKKEFELEKQMLARQMPQTSQEEEDFDYRQLEQEDFPDGKKLAKAFNSFNKKMSSYEKKLVEKEQEILYLKTVQEFPDFKDVVTPENIEKYIKNDEDNKEAVERASNPLRRVYNLIKRDPRYISENQAKLKSSSQELKRVEEKENKPKVGSVGVRSEAVTAAAKISNSALTKEQKTALWKETLAYSRK